MRNGILMLVALSAVATARWVMAESLVTFEAESGMLGANFTNGVDGAVQFISTSTDTVNSGNPGNPNRIATYQVVFPEAGNYNLFARVKIGSGGASDDSCFYGNGFGVKVPDVDANWVLVNSVNVGGFTAPGEVVSGSGAAGIEVWKWINLSQYTGTAGETPITFSVLPGELSLAIQIGARENGFDLDKFAFGTVGTAFAVSNLDAGTLPTAPPPLTNWFAGPEGLAIHRFGPLLNGSNADGANPAAGLMLAEGGLSGTTLNGGAEGKGTAFFVGPDGSNFLTFRTFDAAPTPSNPQAGFTVLGGDLFTTTFAGGNNGVGTVYLCRTNGSGSVLRHFSPLHNHTGTNSGGAGPAASLLRIGNRVYGTTTAGGPAGNGTVFSMTTNGADFTVLHDFGGLDSQSGTNADGAAPWSGLVIAGDRLFGTAAAGGAAGNGVVFSVGTNGAGFAVLHGFSALDVEAATNADGAIPYGDLVLANHTLYGTTFAGGPGGSGAVFSIGTNGAAFAVLHHFAAKVSAAGTNSDGAAPRAGLMVSSNVLYGTASAGGPDGAGAVFSLDLGSGQFSMLHGFTALASNGTNSAGAFPVAPVLRLGNTLYGTTFSGGPGAAGTVYGLPLPGPPALITQIVNNGNNTVTLHFLGGANTTNVVQSAPGLEAPIGWQDVATNVADADGHWQFTDSVSNTNRFYRSHD